LLGGSAVTPARAHAQAGTDPERLWKAFPLERADRVEPPPAPAPAPVDDDRIPERPAQADSSGLPIVPVVIGSLMILALGVRVTIRRGTARAVPAAAQEPRTQAPSNGHTPVEISSVVGYISLTAAERELAVPGLVEQEALIREACARGGWRLAAVLCDDPRALANGRQRPSLEEAIERIDGDSVTHLVVSRLDRLGRSAVELGGILRRLDSHDATLVALEDGIDTSTDAGSKLAGVLAGIADSERDRIAAGTRSGLAAVRAQGRPISRPAVTDHPQLRERIQAMRENGATLQGIADTLNREGVPTLRGGALWRPSSVQAAAGYRRPRQRAHSRPGNGNA